MRPFRAKIRLGASFALFALAVNLAFSFGHHHFDDAIGRGIPAGAEALLAEAAAGSRHQDDADKEHQDPAGAHPCLACAVVTAAAMAAAAPSLSTPAEPQAVRLATASRLELQDTRRAVFEARAPPHA